MRRGKLVSIQRNGQANTGVICIYVTYLRSMCCLAGRLKLRWVDGVYDEWCRWWLLGAQCHSADGVAGCYTFDISTAAASTLVLDFWRLMRTVCFLSLSDLSRKSFLKKATVFLTTVVPESKSSG